MGLAPQKQEFEKAMFYYILIFSIWQVSNFFPEITKHIPQTTKPVGVCACGSGSKKIQSCRNLHRFQMTLDLPSFLNMDFRSGTVAAILNKAQSLHIC